MFGKKKDPDQKSLNDLVDESRRIRDEMLRTTGRLEAFSSQLADRVADLNIAVNSPGGSEHGESSTHQDDSHPSSGGSPEGSDG